MFARYQSPEDADLLQLDRRLMQSYVDVLRVHAARQPHVQGLHEIPNMKDVRRSLSYAQMDLRCRAIAAQLQLVGAVGQRALLAFDNDADYLLSFLACAYAGVIAVPLFAPTQRKHVERFETVAKDCDARFLLTNTAAEARNPQLGLSRAAFPQLQWLLCDLVQDAMAEMWRPTTPAADELAYLQYTSGSTGKPRGVMVSHGNLIYQGRYIESYTQVRVHDRVLSWLPLYHDMGLIMGALQAVYSGKPLWLSTPTAAVMHPKRWLKAISDHRITVSGAPNFVYDLCTDTVDIAGLEGVDLSCWSAAFNGAEPIRPSTIERFARKFGALGFRAEAVHPAYGLAEATLAVTIKQHDTMPVVRTLDAQMLAQDCAIDATEHRASRTLVSCGQPTLETVVCIVNPATAEPCEADTIGEIWVAGPSVAGGYWEKADATQEVFCARINGQGQRFLRTGDLGFLDADNNLFVTGRAKDLIIVAGKNHYPQDIESTVEDVDSCIRARGVVALGVEREAGEALTLLVEIERHAILQNFDAQAVAKAIRHQVNQAHNLAIAEIVFLTPGQLPMTTSGKIQRRACLAMLQADSLQTVARIGA